MSKLKILAGVIIALAFIYRKLITATVEIGSFIVLVGVVGYVLIFLLSRG